MKSKKNFFRSAAEYTGRIINIFIEDRVSVYAAQAALFVIISAVPFISLLLSIVGIILPHHTPEAILGTNVSDGIIEIVGAIFNDLKTAPTISRLSISVVTTLWCASHGINALRGGVGTVYRSKPAKNYLRHRITSLIGTLMFLAFIILLILLVLFGDFLIKQFGGGFTDIIIKFRTPSLILVLSIFFTILYTAVGHRSNAVRHNPIYHLPGGIFASLGWVIFSHLYSLYIINFPSASYIYGGLAAVCLIMLWLYFCMIILLAGSEINKLWFAGCNNNPAPGNPSQTTEGTATTINK